MDVFRLICKCTYTTQALETAMEKVNLWKPNYLLNLDVIDEQHKHFFQLVGVVVQYAEMASGGKESVAKVIRMLGAIRSYAFLHFKTEEDLMLKYGFPYYLKHAEHHNSYLQKMMDFELEFKGLLSELKKDGPDDELLRTFLKDVSEFIASWWETHILSQDSKYAKFIKEKRSANLG